MEAREYFKQIKDNGWFIHDTHGPTRQYVHKKIDGFLTICARHNDRLGPETAKAALQASHTDVDGHPKVVLETTSSGVSAYSPDLSGVVATGEDEMDARSRMSEALALHRHALSGEAPKV